MPPYLEWYDETKTSVISGPIALEQIAGTSGDPFTLWLFNDKGATTGADPAIDIQLQVSVDDGGVRHTSGFPVLDEGWFQARVIDVDKTGDATMENMLSEWLPLGSSRALLLKTIPANCGRAVEFRLVLPAHVNTVTQTVRLEIANGSVVVLAARVNRFGVGIVPDSYDRSTRRLTSPALVVSGLGTQTIKFVSYSYAFDGTSYKIRHYDGVALTQAAADGALVAGQSYIAIISEDPGSGTGPLATKGNRSAAPVPPVMPATHIYIATVTVHYQAGGTSIINAGDIDYSAQVVGEFYVKQGPTPLSVLVGPGTALLEGDIEINSTIVRTVLVEDDLYNGVWLTADNTLAITTDDDADPPSPAAGAEHLATIVAAGGVITSIDNTVKRRVGRSLRTIPMVFRFSGAVMNIVENFGWEPLTFDATLLSVDMHLGHPAICTGAGGTRLRIDIRRFPREFVEGLSFTVGSGESMYDSAADDVRPSLPPAADSASAVPWMSSTEHTTLHARRGDRIVVDIVEVIAASSWTQEPNDLVVILNWLPL